jgi:hypothetical protein
VEDAAREGTEPEEEDEDESRDSESDPFPGRTSWT